MQQDLIQKYNNPVPRYTSYPPANFFSDKYTSSEFIRAIEKSNDWLPQNISIYIHIPFCKRMCFYCGCNSCPIADKSTVKDYVKALRHEISLISSSLDKNRKVAQIHYGGGTPNAIYAEYLQEINEQLFETFDFIEKPEIAIECNPAYLDLPYLDILHEAKFNRYSLGIQDFDLKVLKSVNREPSTLPVSDIMSYVKGKNPEVSFNLDFIYGLPHQSVKSFSDTIKQAIEIRPDRLVTFSYAHVPWVNKAQMMLEKEGLPTSDEKINMFNKAHGLLLDSGYKTIGMDHYVLETDELYQALESGNLHRNFQGYCTRRTTGQVYAFGVSAISQLHKAYAQNTKSNEDYIRSIGRGKLPIVKGYDLSDKEIIIREVINEIMCKSTIEWQEISQRFNIDVPHLKNTIRYDERQLKDFAKDDIIEFSDKHVSITPGGSFFVRNVAASFDPMYNAENNRFSKPV